MKKILCLVVPWLIIASCTDTQSPVRMETKRYFDIDSLVNRQIILLDSLRPVLQKYAWLEDDTDTIRFSPDSAEWVRELEMALQVDLNKPVLRDEYTIETVYDSADRRRVTSYTAKDPDKVEVDRLNLYFEGDKLTKIEGRYREKSLLFNAVREIILQFEEFDNSHRISAYQIDGAQKIIFKDTVLYRVNARIDYN